MIQSYPMQQLNPHKKWWIRQNQLHQLDLNRITRSQLYPAKTLFAFPSLSSSKDSGGMMALLLLHLGRDSLLRVYVLARFGN